MSVTGIIIKQGKELTKKLEVKQNPAVVQKRVLLKLLRKARNTVFGTEYNFNKILESKDVVNTFQETVPIHTYESIHKWWRMLLQGEQNITWPGKVEYFALSSGTSEGSSKYIPVTKSMLRAMQRVSVRQMRALAHCKIPVNFFQKDILMLGGSTSLENHGIYYAGDLSGITTGKLPFWFRPFYKPGREISKTRDWQEKLKRITREAHNWDVGAIVGVPSWLQLLMEQIIEYYKVKTIHDVWPNLYIFVHGGVALEPYKKSFEQLLGKPLIYLETYLASEGFIAYQNHPKAEGLRLNISNGIFYEFVPFNDSNYTNGDLHDNPEIITINEIEENTDYALLLTTCAGAWRYQIGDIIRFTNKEKLEIRITGRTKHFLSLCGEHLSVDNMNRAIELASEELNIKVREFTVAGAPVGRYFAHHWYIGIEDHEINPEVIRDKIDEKLKMLNDDYRTERDHFLKDIEVHLVQPDIFMQWLKFHGKEGAQIKFPKVLKNEQYRQWLAFLEKGEEIITS